MFLDLTKLNNEERAFNIQYAAHVGWEKENMFPLVLMEIQPTAINTLPRCLRLQDPYAPINLNLQHPQPPKYMFTLSI